MQLRWTEEAAADLERIADYLFEHTPEHAPRIVRTIYDAAARLLAFPGLGRKGRMQGTRELVLVSLPYLVIYTLIGETFMFSVCCTALKNGLDDKSSFSCI